MKFPQQILVCVQPKSIAWATYMGHHLGHVGNVFNSTSLPKPPCGLSALGVQFGEYFQSVLAESGIGYYSILLIIWHFCHKN